MLTRRVVVMYTYVASLFQQSCHLVNVYEQVTGLFREL